MLSLLGAAPCAGQDLLDQGYHQMYDRDFAAAHRTFSAWEGQHPEDPMGPVSDAAAYLFSEFDRLHILQSEFFSNDAAFLRRQRNFAPGAAAKRDFESVLLRGQRLASAELARSPDDENALLAEVLVHGLRADFLSLIERRNFAALAETKEGCRLAERLLALHPACYDAYLAIGIENYLLGLHSLPVRWLLRLGGAQSDTKTGIERLRITAEKGRYFLPYARLMLAIAALRDRDKPTARRMLGWLAAEFPDNDLYRQELQKLR